MWILKLWNSIFEKHTISYLCFWESKCEEEYGNKAAHRVQVPSSILEILDEIEKRLGYNEVEGPVEAGGDAHPLASEPQGINLRRKSLRWW